MTNASPIDGIEDNIGRAAKALLRQQREDGHWVFELEADATIPAEYVLLEHFLDRIDAGFALPLVGPPANDAARDEALRRQREHRRIAARDFVQRPRQVGQASRTESRIDVPLHLQRGP